MKYKLAPVSDIFDSNPINLLVSGPLGKGYELGHICGCYYDSSNIPSNEILIRNLRKLTSEYSKLLNSLVLEPLMNLIILFF